MKKKIIALTVAAVLLIMAVIGGTYAYLTDTESAKNVMTTGNVNIEQNEYERGQDGALIQFTQNKPIFPAVFTNGSLTWDPDLQSWEDAGSTHTASKLFNDDMKNVIDKFVFVTNNSTTDVYVRTIVAIEAPQAVINNKKAEDYLHLNFNFDNQDYNDGVDGAQDINNPEYFYIELDGVKYVVFTATYLKALAPEEVSAPSLLQVFLNPAATNEVCAEFGETLDILTLSQAVQADGFDDADVALDEAFGDVTATTAANWFKNIN